tara:strand:+ start:573 stop:836 length:264 start_codon:yes stop_codon:yes gene_type:complete
MKSALELALERSGGALNELSDAKKDQIAEIDNVLKAKLAEIELTYQRKFEEARGDAEAIKQLGEDQVTEVASAKSKAERNKDAVRNS